jgi:hypothetical protein
MQAPKADLARQTDHPPGLTIEELTIGVPSKVVPADDASAMATPVGALLSDDEKRAEAGKRAREYAERTFQISEIAARSERLLQRLATGTPRRPHSFQLCDGSAYVPVVPSQARWIKSEGLPVARPHLGSPLGLTVRRGSRPRWALRGPAE